MKTKVKNMKTVNYIQCILIHAIVNTVTVEYSRDKDAVYEPGSDDTGAIVSPYKEGHRHWSLPPQKSVFRI